MCVMAEKINEIDGEHFVMMEIMVPPIYFIWYHPSEDTVGHNPKSDHTSLGQLHFRIADFCIFKS